VRVPPPGYTVANNIVATNGAYKLMATNANGRLTVRESRMLASSAPRPATAVADPACSEDEHQFIGGNWAQTQVPWYINTSTIANRTNLDVATAVSNIRQGNSNMTTGQNNCGFIGQPAAFGAYQGSTSRFANINANLNCTSTFPDGQNTHSFGPDNLFDQVTHSGPIAVTCDNYNTVTGRMIESDIYFGSDVRIVNTLPANCLFAIDLQTVATHEWDMHTASITKRPARTRSCTRSRIRAPCAVTSDWAISPA
jgi:hypothetical protein